MERRLRLAVAEASYVGRKGARREKLCQRSGLRFLQSRNRGNKVRVDTKACEQGVHVKILRLLLGGGCSVRNDGGGNNVYMPSSRG